MTLASINKFTNFGFLMKKKQFFMPFFFLFTHFIIFLDKKKPLHNIFIFNINGLYIEHIALKKIK
jgi:hypothetical protein